MSETETETESSFETSEETVDVNPVDLTTEVWDELEADTSTSDSNADDELSSKADDEQTDEVQAVEPEGEGEEKQTDKTVQAAPEHWSDALKENFDDLPLEAKSIVLDMAKSLEAVTTRKSQALSEQQKEFEPLSQVIKEESEYLQAKQIQLPVAIKSAITWDKKLSQGTDEQRYQNLVQFAREYGLDISGQPAHAIQQDPQVQNLASELSFIKQRFQQQEQERLNTEREEASHTVESFKSAKGDDGKLKYPYFEDVREDMGDLLDAGKASDLETAYNKAIRLNDDVWERIQTKEKQREAALHMNQVKEAKKAASVNQKSKPNLKPKDYSRLNTREIASAVYDELTAS